MRVDDGCSAVSVIRAFLVTICVGAVVQMLDQRRQIRGDDHARNHSRVELSLVVKRLADTRGVFHPLEPEAVCDGRTRRDAQR